MKSLEQLEAQWHRIVGYVREKGQFIKYMTIYARYSNRMYDYLGGCPYYMNRLIDVEKANTPVPRDVYMR